MRGARPQRPRPQGNGARRVGPPREAVGAAPSEPRFPCAPAAPPPAASAALRVQPAHVGQQVLPEAEHSRLTCSADLGCRCPPACVSETAASPTSACGLVTTAFSQSPVKSVWPEPGAGGLVPCSLPLGSVGVRLCPSPP